MSSESDSTVIAPWARSSSSRRATGTSGAPARAVKVIMAGVMRGGDSMRRSRPVLPCGNRLIERGDAVRQIAAEAEHEAHRHLRGGHRAERLGAFLADEGRHADQSFRRDLLADLGDLFRPPQHRHGGDREPCAPGGKQRQRRQSEIGKLRRDRVAGLEPKLDEERGERIDGRVGLAIGEGLRHAEAERLQIGRIAQRGHAWSLARATPQQSVRRKRRANLLPLDRFGVERHGRSGLVSRLAAAPASGSSHQESI